MATLGKTSIGALTTPLIFDQPKQAITYMGQMPVDGALMRAMIRFGMWTWNHSFRCAVYRNSVMNAIGAVKVVGDEAFHVAMVDSWNEDLLPGVLKAGDHVYLSIISDGTLTIPFDSEPGFVSWRLLADPSAPFQGMISVWDGWAQTLTGTVPSAYIEYQPSGVVPPATGNLFVHCIDRNGVEVTATVQVDGKNYNAPTDFPLPLAPGDHPVYMVFWDMLKNASITAGQDTTLTFNEPVSPPPGTLGDVEIHAYEGPVEVGATAAIDGASLPGVTPMTVTNLIPGTHTVSVVYKGYTKVQAVTVIAGAVTLADFLFAIVVPPSVLAQVALPVGGALAGSLVGYALGRKARKKSYALAGALVGGIAGTIAEVVRERSAG